MPPVGSRGRAPGQGVWGRSAPEAEHNYTFHKPIFAEFWCHFGKIPTFCKLLKLGLHVPWQFLTFFRKHKRCCFDKLMYVRSIGFKLGRKLHLGYAAKRWCFCTSQNYMISACFAQEPSTRV